MNVTLTRAQFSGVALAGLLSIGLAACGGSGSGSTPATTGSSSSGGGTSGSGSGSGSTPAPCVLGSTAGTLTITPPSCPAGTQGSAYAGCTVAASGGTPPYSYCVSTAASNPPLPEGMTIDATTGAISSALIGGQGYYGTKIIATDAAKNSTSTVIYFSINGNNGYLSTIFPADSIFHHRVDALTTSLPVDSSPAAAINSSDLSAPITVFFGNQFSSPWPYGTPTIQVPATQPMVTVTTSPYHAYFSSGPIPSYAPVEGTQYSTGDRHVVVYQAAGTGTTAALYEMYQGIYTNTNGSGSWSDASNGVWTDATTSYTLLTQGSTNAAGLPNGPLLVTADEVIGSGTPSAPTGSIQHTIRFNVTQMLDNWVWPGTTASGSATCTGTAKYTLLSQSAPPTACPSGSGPAGEIYRLKASATIPTCVSTSPQSAIIMTALATYGIILSDNGTPGQIIGTPDARWNDADLACLSNLSLNDFEPVNVSTLMISATSAQTSH